LFQPSATTGASAPDLSASNVSSQCLKMNGARSGLDDARFSHVLRRVRVGLRFLGLVLSSLALVVSLLLVSLAIWLHTAGGRGQVERALVRETRERLGLTLSVGRTRGNVIGGIRLERIVLSDAQGRLVARADALSVRYRLVRLIRRHEVDEIAVARPVIVSLPKAGAPGASPRGEPPAFSVHRLTVTGGSLRFSGHRVQQLSASTAIDFGQSGARVEGVARLILDEQPLFIRARAERNGARVQLSADLHGAAFDARGTVVGPLDALDVELRGRTDDRGLALIALVDVPRGMAHVTASVAAREARTGATRFSGTAHVDANRVDATLEARVAPAEAAAIGIHPVAPIRLQVLLHGPVRALDVHADAQLRAARVALDGRIDLHGRRGQLRAVAHDVRPSEIEPRAPPLAFSGAFTFDGAIHEHTGVAGNMSVTDGSLRVADQSFDRLQGAGRVRLGRQGEAHVESLSGQLEASPPRQIKLAALIRWDRRSVRVDAKRADVDENRATGEVVYTTDPGSRQSLVTIHARQLSLSPALVEEALHRRPQKAWRGDAQLAWTRDESRLAFALDTDLGPAKGAVRLRRSGGGIELPSIAVNLGGSRLRGAARVEKGEIVASLDELLLDPELAHSLSPALEPARTVRIEGALAGPLDALDLYLLASAGASTARLRGRIDLRARSFRLFAELDTFYLQSIKQTRTSRVNLELSLIGRLVEGGVASALTVRHASGTIEGLPLEAARLDVKLDGPRFNVEQALIGVPGAVLEASGGGTYRDFHVGYGVVVTDALELRKVPKPLRLTIGLTALTPGRSVVGSVERHAGGDVKITHHAIPPPFRVLNLLGHLLTGHPLHFTVQ
jgi:hypothetical protein